MYYVGNTEYWGTVPRVESLGGNMFVARDSPQSEIQIR